MCLLAIGCPVSLTIDFAVHFQNRDLTTCPATAITMTCTVLKDASGTGTGSFTVVGSAISPGTLVLDSFDPAGCYNIRCETSDTIASTRVEWNGSFVNDNSSGMRTSFGVPYYLSGAAGGSGCTKLAPSCEALDITAKSTRAAPAGADLSLYTCAKVTFACEPSCFECPSGLIALSACPADVHDCGCPAGSYLYNGICKPKGGCDDSSDSKDGSKSGGGDSSKTKDCGTGGADNSSDSKDSPNSKSDGKDGSKGGGDSKDGSGSKGGGKVDPGTKDDGKGTKSEDGKSDYGSKNKGDDSKEGGSKGSGSKPGTTVGGWHH